MSKPDPIDPVTMVMAQLAVQNIVIEYLLATITGSLDQNQKGINAQGHLEYFA